MADGERETRAGPQGAQEGRALERVHSATSRRDSSSHDGRGLTMNRKISELKIVPHARKFGIYKAETKYCLKHCLLVMNIDAMENIPLEKITGHLANIMNYS